MKRSLRTSTWVIATLALLLAGMPALAQGNIQQDTPRLTWRYDILLKAKSPQAQSAAQESIASERAAIRKEMEQEIAKTVQMEESAPETVDLVRILDSQQSAVSRLSEHVDATNADLSLLKKEEEYYISLEKTGTGAPPPGLIMQTKSHAELLAKKAVLEDRLAVLQAMLNTQQERLDNLRSEQQVRNIGVLLGILTTLGIFFAVFWVERFIRTFVIGRLRHRHLRYAVAKTFTFIVYVSLTFWFIQKILSEHPGIATVLAVVGAALVFVTQDIIKGLIGWFGMKNALVLGQRVSIGPLTGDVIDIGLLHTTLLISRTTALEEVGQVGKLVRIPNERLLSQYVVNYHSTSDFENVEFSITLAQSGQWEAAQKILEDILKKETDGFAERAQRQHDQRMRGFFASHAPLSWRVYMELTEKREVRLSICFPAPIGQRRAVTTVISKEILRKFAEAGISLSESA